MGQFVSALQQKRKIFKEITEALSTGNTYSFIFNIAGIVTSVRTNNYKINLTQFVLVWDILFYIVFPAGRMPVLMTSHMHIRSPDKYRIGH